MRKLILLRHAKSSWALPGVDDFDRPLNNRGNKAAPAMGSWLKNEGYMPDIVLSSSAKRTRETANHLAHTLGLNENVNFLDSFYLATADKIRNELTKLVASIKTAMIIAHNPGLHDLALRLLTEEERKQSGTLRVSYPTAACTIISLPIEGWQEISWDKGTLISHMIPKSLTSSALA